MKMHLRSVQMRKEMLRVCELSINKVSIPVPLALTPPIPIRIDHMPSVQKPLVLMLPILMGTAPMLHDSNATCLNNVHLNASQCGLNANCQIAGQIAKIPLDSIRK